MEPEAPPTLPRYRLAPPTEDDALGMLARVLGPEGAASTWLRCCREAGVSCGNGGMRPADLLRVGERLADEQGAPGVIGTSLAVRARTYLLLGARHAGPGPDGGS